MDVIGNIIDSLRNTNSQKTNSREQELRKLVSASMNKTIADKFREKNSGKVQ